MIAGFRTWRAGRLATLAAALACTTAVAASPASAHEPPPLWEFMCGGERGDAVAWDESHKLQKLPDARDSMLGFSTTTPISDRLRFPDLTPYGFDLYCIRVVADVVHPDRSDLLVEVRLPGAAGWQVVYKKGKPGRELHLSADRLWSQPGSVWLRITDVVPGGTGALVYWRAEGHYRASPGTPPAATSGAATLSPLPSRTPPLTVPTSLVPPRSW